MTITLRMLSLLIRFPLEKVSGDNNTKNALTFEKGPFRKFSGDYNIKNALAVEKVSFEKVPGDNNQKLIFSFEFLNSF